MHRRFSLALIVVLASAFPSLAAPEASLRVEDPRCEYLVNPLGVDARARG